MARSVAAPQSSVAPSVAQEVAPPQQDQSFPWLDVFQGASGNVTMTMAAYGTSALGNDFLKDMLLAPQRMAAARAAAPPALTPAERYAMATTPEEKLAAWKEMHLADAHARFGEAEDAPWYDVFGMSDAAHRNEIKAQTLASTSAEVEDEISALQAKHAADGTPLTMDEVEALALRKRTELDIEETHGVNLTNDAGATEQERREDPAAAAKKDADRRVWSMDELGQANEAFSNVNVKHLEDNHEIKEFRRSARDEVSGTRKGDYKKGVISVYDQAQTEPLDWETGRTVDGASGGVAQALGREIAMGIAAQNPEAYAAATGALTGGSGGVLHDLMPSAVGADGEDRWAGAAYSAEAAWQQLMSKRMFSPEQTKDEFIDAPAAEYHSDNANLQRAMHDKLVAKRAGADPVELGMLEKDVEVQGSEVRQEQEAVKRRDSIWSLIDGL